MIFFEWAHEFFWPCDKMAIFPGYLVLCLRQWSPETARCFCNTQKIIRDRLLSLLRICIIRPKKIILTLFLLYIFISFGIHNNLLWTFYYLSVSLSAFFFFFFWLLRSHLTSYTEASIIHDVSVALSCLLQISQALVY